MLLDDCYWGEKEGEVKHAWKILLLITSLYCFQKNCSLTWADSFVQVFQRSYRFKALSDQVFGSAEPSPFFQCNSLRPLHRPQVIIHSFEQWKSNSLRFNSLSELHTILCLHSNQCVFNTEYSEIMNCVWYLMTFIWFFMTAVFLQGQHRVWRSSFSFLFFF